MMDLPVPPPDIHRSYWHTGLPEIHNALRCQEGYSRPTSEGKSSGSARVPVQVAATAPEWVLEEPELLNKAQPCFSCLLNQGLAMVAAHRIASAHNGPADVTGHPVHQERQR